MFSFVSQPQNLSVFWFLFVCFDLYLCSTSNLKILFSSVFIHLRSCVLPGCLCLGCKHAIRGGESDGEKRSYDDRGRSLIRRMGRGRGAQPGSESPALILYLHYPAVKWMQLLPVDPWESWGPWCLFLFWGKSKVRPSTVVRIEI